MLRSFGWRNVIALFITFALFDHFGHLVRDYVSRALPVIFADVVVIVLGFGVFIALSVVFERVSLGKR